MNFVCRRLPMRGVVMKAACEVRGEWLFAGWLQPALVGCLGAMLPIRLSERK
jgi:hypothetical protein